MFEVKWNNNILIDQYGNASSPLWTQYSFNVMGTGSDSITIIGYHNYGWENIDDISVTLDIPVPESSSFGIVSIGLLAIVLFARHRRNRVACTT